MYSSVGFFHKIFDFDFRLFRSVFCHFSYHFRIIWPQAIHFFESSSFFSGRLSPLSLFKFKNCAVQLLSTHWEKLRCLWSIYGANWEPESRRKLQLQSRIFSVTFYCWNLPISLSENKSLFWCKILFTCTLAVVWGLYTTLWLYGLDTVWQKLSVIFFKIDRKN